MLQDVPRCARSLAVLGYLGISMYILWAYGHLWTIPIGPITCLWHGVARQHSVAHPGTLLSQEDVRCAEFMCDNQWTCRTAIERTLNLMSNCNVTRRVVAF